MGILEAEAIESTGDPGALHIGKAVSKVSPAAILMLHKSTKSVRLMHITLLAVALVACSNRMYREQGK